MHFRVFHCTTYGYERPPASSVQVLKLTARQDTSQSVIDWKVMADGHLHAWSDAFGNACHTLVNRSVGTTVDIVAEGEVITKDMLGVHRDFGDTMPREVFLNQTARTLPNNGMMVLADEIKPLLADNALNAMHRLMDAVRERIQYAGGETDVSSTGADAFSGGRGVCQDHAHVFIGCARHLGVPARYVSGYLYNGEQDRPFPAGHAWASAWIDDLGWVGFDISNGIAPYEHHICIATGLDYDSAAPVRGTCLGETVGETMSVALMVEALS